MFDKSEQEVINKIKAWANNDENVRAVILTSSRTNPNSKPDKLSDFDIEVIANSTDHFNRDEWLDYFGETLVKWPLYPSNTGYNPNSITRLVVFTDFPRIDFQIISLNNFKPNEYDNGFKVLVDKNKLKDKIQPATHQEFIVSKPTKNDFFSTVDGFYWDIPYIAKSLRRNEIAFAKFMLFSAIRYESFERMLVWYIGASHDWQVNFGAHGRNLEKLTTNEFASRINNLNAGSDKQEIWQATQEMVAIFDEMEEYIEHKLNFGTPPVNKKDVLQMCNNMLNIEL